jgi:hypothetical protein
VPGLANWQKEDDCIAKHAQIEELKPQVAARANTATTSAPPETTKDKQPEAEPPLLEQWDLGGDTGPIPRLAGGRHLRITKTDQRAANYRLNSLF